MANPNLIGMLDGGPHQDPREIEEEQLLNDGADADGAEDEWGSDTTDPGGERPVRKAVAEPDAEEPEEKEEEPEPKEEVAEEEPDAEPDTKPAAKKLEEKPKVDPKTEYKSIPYQRFRKELMKRHELAAEVAAARAESTDLKKRLESFEAGVKKAADPEPDASLYPQDHLAWKNRQLEARLAQLEKPAPREAPVAPQTADALVSALREDAESYTESEKPDFVDAYHHAVQATAQVVANMNPTWNQAQVAAHVNSLELSEVQAALRAGESPAARIYAIAERQGYKPKAAPTKPGSGVRDRVTEAAADAGRRTRANSVVNKGAPSRERETTRLTEDEIERMSNSEIVRVMDRNSGRANPLRA